MKENVIQFAERRLNEEEKQNRLGADNDEQIRYWVAYIEGANAQLKECNKNPHGPMRDMLVDAQIDLEDVKERLANATAACGTLFESLKRTKKAAESVSITALKRVEWLPVFFDNKPYILTCSNCKAVFTAKFKYCPDCGAKMEDE